MAFFIVVGLMPAMNDSVYADEGPVAKVTSNDGEFTKKCDTMLDVIIFITSHGQILFQPSMLMEAM